MDIQCKQQSIVECSFRLMFSVFLRIITESEIKINVVKGFLDKIEVTFVGLFLTLIFPQYCVLYNGNWNAIASSSEVVISLIRLYS